MDRHVLLLGCLGLDPGGSRRRQHMFFAKSIAKSTFFNFMQFSGKIGQNYKLVSPVLELHRQLGNPGSATDCWVVGLCLLMII